MRVLLLYAHPVETSFCAHLHERALAALKAAGHEVDDCDLYAEGFDPVLSRDERLGYHDLETNREPVAAHVERLLRAEALVLVHPVWNFGPPAILKGYLDRVFLPGVSFRLENGVVAGNLTHIRALTAVTTYGGTRLRAFFVGDPPRAYVKRLMRRLIAPGAPVRYHALYDMNRASEAARIGFADKVAAELGRL